MKKNIFIVAFCLLMGMVNAQTSEELIIAYNSEVKTLEQYSILSNLETTESAPMLANSYYSSFGRDEGFVIRPELYRGIYASFGYQVNPYFQPFASIGFVLDYYLGTGVYGAVGCRAYTSESKWAAMFDLRASIINFGILGISATVGASWKNLDFGLGYEYYTDGYYYLAMPVLTIGYNIRFS